ncbi:hypothetical protein HBI38_002890 [Parastagonospora nodorum]|nr:hypothetical protein HBI38_002890 [Parastagonospora nodorum]
MSYRRSLEATETSSSVIEISDAEEIYLVSDDDTSRKDANDRRLAQAVNYLQHEGGNDSHATYMDRVNRIDEALLNQLPHQGPMFSHELYQQVRALVIGVRRDFDNAAQQDSFDMDSHDELAYIDSPMAFEEEALYRGDSQSPTPTPAPSKRRTSNVLAPRSLVSEEKVQRVRSFKYGGDSEIESWHSDYPASLPFPETLMMAHWESMKIDFDINRPKDAATAETIVPLEIPQMQQYFELPLYESGSRFKLPTVSDEDQVAVNKLGTKLHLQKVVDKFFERDQTNGGKKDYVPRLFLENFNVDHQWAPDRLRSKLNASPTKSRTFQSATTGKITLSHSSPIVNDTCIRHTDYDPVPPRKLTKTTAISQRASSPAFRRISKEVRRESVVHPASCTEAKATPTPPTTFSTRLKSKPTPLATFSTRPKSTPAAPATFSTRPKTTTAATTRTLSHVAIPIKKPRGRPPKNPKPVTATASSVSAIRPDPTPLKRKPSLGSQPYETPKSSIKKVLRDNKRQKSVVFVEAPIALEEDSEDPNYPASPVCKPARASTRASVSKAAAAGKMSKARKDSGSGGRMTTRSGNAYY